VASERSTICAAIAVITLSLVAGLDAAAEPVTTRAGQHENFGRIVFDWSAEVAFEAKIADGTLRISFARNLETDLGAVRKRLAKYVAAAEIASDGRSLSFALTRPFDLRAFTVEKKAVVVDLMELAPAAGGTGPVEVRVGEHPDFTRIVFDWLRLVDYSVRREDDQARIIFARPEVVDLSELQGNLPRLIRSARVSREDESSIVSLGLPPDARLRNFRHGTKIVIDVLAGRNTTGAAAAAGPTEAPLPKIISPKLTGRGAPGPPRRLVPPPQTASADELAPTPAPSPPPALPKSKTEDAATPAVPARKPKSAAVASNSTPQNAQERKSARSGPAGESQDQTLRVTVLESPDVTRLSFPWKDDVAAAIFERAGYLWVVFDRPVAADLSMLRLDPEGVLVAAEQVENPAATVLRFQTRPGLIPIVRGLDTTWFVDLAEQPVAMADVIEVEPQPHEASGARLFLPLAYIGERVEVNDPEVGDQMIVVPVAPPVRAVVAARDFLEVKVLASAHGIAVVPKADGVQVETTTSGVAITRAMGLLLSGRQAALARPDAAPASSAAEPPLILDLAAWRQAPLNQYNEIRQVLLREIADAPVERRNDSRLELARFYLAHRFAADAQAALAAALERDPDAAEKPQVRAMLGAINFFLNRFDAAEKFFGHASFDGNQEIAIWRGATAASREQWQRAYDAFAFGSQGVESYPADLRHGFDLLAARAAMETGDFVRAKSVLDWLAVNDPPEPLQSEVTLLWGQNQERLGNLESALESYGEASRSSYRRIRARAEFARINLLFKKGELIPVEAIERLERLRFTWRGDEFELALLRQLGELYVGRGEFRRGLSSLRHAITYFPGNTETRTVAKEMNTLFERLFLGGGADTMTPVSALALYYEFRELTPLGPKGDEMIRRLADRLVAVDLLGRAAKLLDHQINFRVTAGERAKVGARLAVIYMLDNRPDDALKVLNTTEWQPLTPELVAERQQLKARTLSEIGRFDEALDLIKNDDTEVAVLLRGEIRWREKNWGEAARAYEALLGDRWQQDEPLDDASRRHLLKLAVSLALAGDEPGLERVRNRYHDKISDGADAEAFRVVTGEIDTTGTEFRRLAGQIAQTDRLEAFMASYRDKLAQGGLNAIN
jgi:tetratricopeptide (TPR) repeat protein